VDIILGSLTPAVLVAQADLALHAFHKDLTTKWPGHQGPFFYARAADLTMALDHGQATGAKAHRSGRYAPLVQKENFSSPERGRQAVRRSNRVDPHPYCGISTFSDILALFPRKANVCS